MARKFVLSRQARARLEVDFEKELNHQQLAAATCGEGPKLVIAGAGTGKTRTLTYRMAYLMSRDVPPDHILMVTFTNKAAREMLGRVRQLTGVESHQMWGGTFHAVGARVLRRFGGLLGYDANFSILDEADQRDLLRLCVTDLEIDVEKRRFPTPRVLSGIFSYAINTRTPLDELLPDRYPRFAEWAEAIERVESRYRERKQEANAVDYDDLLVLWLRLLQEHPEVRRRYGRQFEHVLVDEYQDTNVIQAEIAEALAEENGGNLMVVGDDCQSIYAFRGANYDNILNFPERNPDTEIFRLEINYRSTPEILDITNASIRCNVDQYHKTLEPRRSPGMMPAVVACSYPDQEAAFVAERILQLRDEGVDLRDVAVLYRAHAHRLHLETTFLRYDIPYVVRGGLRFFEQAHIKDVVAYLRILENPRDEVAFRRILLQQSGIGNVTADRLWSLAGGNGIVETDELIDRLASTEARQVLLSRARSGWDRFVEGLRTLEESDDDPEGLIRSILASGYEDYAAGQYENFESRMEDIEQLALFAGQYDGLDELLEELVLLGELYGQDVAGGMDADESAIVLSTIHQAKGLEWNAVFIVNLVEGGLPSPRSLDEPDGEQEERRVFYVAMTRARDELYLTYPIMRPGAGGGALVQQPSRFLQELGDDLWERWELEDPDAGGSPEGRGGRGFGRGSRQESEDGGSHDPNVDPVWDDEDYIDDIPWDEDDDVVH